MKKTKKTQSEIIADLHTSHTGAFDYIFDIFFTRLEYFAEKFVDRPEAEDIVLETLHKFWERRNSFHTTDSIKGFLYITVRNRCLDSIRSNTTVQKRNQELTYLKSQEFEKHAELSIIETEFINRIYEDLNKLPTKCQRVFKMKYVQGLSTSEIANDLNISEDTVRNHIAYALKLLRKSLGSQLLMVCLLNLPYIHKAHSAEHSTNIYSDSPFFDPCLFKSPSRN